MTRTTILVTGASSGIGAALAKAYASPGAHLILWGRNAQRLDQSARDCRALGAAVQTLQFDLRDAGAIAGHIETYDDATPIDIAILNAGLGGPSSANDAAESADRAFEVATVNFTAQVVGANAVAACMAKRGRGNIVLMSSVADTIPLPIAPTYAGSKAGLKMFAESLGIRLERHGVVVTLVSPGFVDTPMSRQVSTPKPFMITAEAAAAIIKRKIDSRKTRIVVPLLYAALLTLFPWIPGPVRRKVLRAMPRS